MAPCLCLLCLLCSMCHVQPFSCPNVQARVWHFAGGLFARKELHSEARETCLGERLAIDDDTTNILITTTDGADHRRIAWAGVGAGAATGDGWLAARARRAWRRRAGCRPRRTTRPGPLSRADRRRCWRCDRYRP